MPLERFHCLGIWFHGGLYSHNCVARRIDCETLASELWLYPRDSRVSLNGSGMLIVNPPYLLAERMQVWLPELQRQLDVGHEGGTSIQMLPASTS